MYDRVHASRLSMKKLGAVNSLDPRKALYLRRGISEFRHKPHGIITFILLFSKN